MGRGDVVRDAVDPRSHRTPAFEPGQAAPQGDMDLLKQIAPPVGILLICARQPPERAAGFRGTLSIEPLSASGRTMHSHQVVAGVGGFLRAGSAEPVPYGKRAGPDALCLDQPWPLALGPDLWILTAEIACVVGRAFAAVHRALRIGTERTRDFD